MYNETLNFLIQLIHSPLFISAMLGAGLGLERELAGKDPSLRTFTLICLGSCLFTILSHSITHSLTYAEGARVADPGRIAAQIIPGIGFLGAGTIFRSQRGVSGLTTAALMWVTAAIGMAVGFGEHELALEATFVALLLMLILKWVHRALSWVRVQSEPKGPRSVRTETTEQ